MRKVVVVVVVKVVVVEVVKVEAEGDAMASWEARPSYSRPGWLTWAFFERGCLSMESAMRMIMLLRRKNFGEGSAAAADCGDDHCLKKQRVIVMERGQGWRKRKKRNFCIELCPHDDCYCDFDCDCCCCCFGDAGNGGDTESNGGDDDWSWWEERSARVEGSDVVVDFPPVMSSFLWESPVSFRCHHQRRQRPQRGCAKS